MFLNKLLIYVIYILMLLLTMAFFTIGERKLMGSIQRRKGPDVVGFWGLLQAFADGLKLFLKEFLIPLRTSIVLYILGPILIFLISLSCWVVIPLSSLFINTMISYSLLYVYILTSFNVYGLFFAGWSSNSRYAFLGGIRAIAQMISYELIFGTINLFIFLFAQSINYLEIILIQQYSIYFIFPLYPLFFIYIIVMLAETNRTPFDLAEAEAELVAGYNVEYSAMTFAFFFLGEYANMLFLSIICVYFFFGGWSWYWSPIFDIWYILNILIFFFKIIFFCCIFIWVRATLPRYRYDQLMELGWKSLLPFLFSYFFLILIYLTLINKFLYLILIIINYNYISLFQFNINFLIQFFDFFIDFWVNFFDFEEVKASPRFLREIEILINQPRFSYFSLVIKSSSSNDNWEL